jgi:beta-lactamase regulating signal transducer with metallopeptidase domain
MTRTEWHALRRAYARALDSDRSDALYADRRDTHRTSYAEALLAGQTPAIRDALRPMYAPLTQRQRHIASRVHALHTRRAKHAAMLRALAQMDALFGRAA